MRIRAAVHVHSEWSYDGSWPLARLASYFRKTGYNSILMTEHDQSFDEDRWQSYRQACKEQSANNFLLIPGIEYSDPENVVHILTWGDMPFLGEKRETGELLRDISEAKGLAVMAHPARRKAWQKYQEEWADFLLGVELWNRKVDGVAPGFEAITLINRNPQLIPFVALDFHRGNQTFPLYMTCPVNQELSEETVLNALKRKEGLGKVAGIPIEKFASQPLYGVSKKLEQLRQYLRVAIKGKKA